MEIRLNSEALNIKKYRTKWQSELVKKQFDMGMKLSIGITNLVFSFAPAKIVKFLTMVGFPSNLDQALADIHEVSDSADALSYIPASMTLLLYYGLIEPIYGVGESRKDIICEIAEQFIKCDLYGHLNYFVCGAREVSLGNLENSIQYENKTREALSYLGNTTFVTNVFNLLNWSLSGKYDECIEALEMFDQMKIKAYSPSFLIYIHAAALRLKMDEEGNDHLEEVIARKLR